MGSADFRINSHVRQVLARHWIEIEAMSTTSINGVLYFRGKIHYRAAKRAAAGEIDQEALVRIEAELRQIKDVKRIRWQLDNWLREENGWVPIGEAADARKREAAGQRKDDKEKKQRLQPEEDAPL